jgi:hypothetical protein
MPRLGSYAVCFTRPGSITYRTPGTVTEVSEKAVQEKVTMRGRATRRQRAWCFTGDVGGDDALAGPADQEGTERAGLVFGRQQPVQRHRLHLRVAERHEFVVVARGEQASQRRARLVDLGGAREKNQNVALFLWVVAAHERKKRKEAKTTG